MEVQKLNMEYLYVLYAIKLQALINGKKEEINGYFIKIMLDMLHLVFLMILLKNAGKKLEDLILNNGIKIGGFAAFANFLLKNFFHIFQAL